MGISRSKSVKPEAKLVLSKVKDTAKEVQELLSEERANMAECEPLASCVESIIEQLNVLKQDNLSSELENHLGALVKTLEETKDFVWKQESRGHVKASCCKSPDPIPNQKHSKELCDRLTEHKKHLEPLQEEKDGAVSTKQVDMDDTNTTGVSTGQNTGENTNEGTGEKADSFQRNTTCVTEAKMVSAFIETGKEAVQWVTSESGADVVKAITSIIPPVKAVVQVLLQLCKKYKENTKECAKLEDHVEFFNHVLVTLEEQDDLKIQSNMLDKKMADLKGTLDAAETLLKEQNSPGHWQKIKRFFKANTIQGHLEELHEKLEVHRGQFTVLLQLEQRGAIGGLAEAMEKNNAMTSGIDGKLDNIGSKLEEMDSKITEKMDKITNGWSPTESQQALKKKLSEKFHNVRAVIPKRGEAASLEEIYTELYITEGECEEVSTEHEVRQIEMASKKKKEDTPIKYTDIFKPLPGQGKHIRTVMTKGVAGIGKTISVKKFILDWAKDGDKPDKDGAKQEIDFLFPVPFREINGIRNTSKQEKKYTLVEFIDHFFSVKCDLIFSADDKYNIAFIFDGLDESRLPLDFENNEDIRIISEPATVDVLLTNLIKGYLLPSAQIWITSRPAAANQIPPECVDQVTVVQGFTDPQKEEYFKKNINEQEMANRIITHLKSSRTLYIMCHIPVFCWMAATVLVSILTKSKSDEIPASLTHMYIHFLVIQAKHISKKYGDICYQKTVLSLGRLAFQQLEKGNLIFYAEDLKKCGMDAEEASDYSGVCTQIFREEESGLYQEKVFCFVHLSIQEFLAAIYVFLCFSNRDRDMSDQQQTSELSALFRAATLHDLHKTAMGLALQSNNGHLDLFLRFLLGLSLESNQKHLQDLLSQTSSQSQNSGDTVQYVKEKIRGQSNSERGINLFYCLNELNQHAVVEHIYRKEGQLSVKMLLPGEWRTVTFKLKMSEEQLNGFDLQKYLKTPEKDQTDLLSPDDVLQKLVPVVTTSTRAGLERCDLTDKSCLHLASVLSSPSSRLTCLELQNNDLGDSGVELLCSGLQHQHCRLETLKLYSCNLTDKSCLHLASVLSSPSSRLTWLNLHDNALGDSGVKHLCSGLQHQHCRLETLKLESCNLTDKSCLHLASVLSSPSSRLTCLELQLNDLGDSGVKHLCSGLQHQHCRLETLKLSYCKLTGKSCSLLASVLSSPSSRLKELDLQDNYDLRASDVKQLYALRRDPNCRLETLEWR